MVFELADGSKLIIENPNVTAMNAQGQKIYSVTGEAKEEKGINEEDLKMVIEQSNAGREEAIKGLTDPR